MGSGVKGSGYGLQHCKKCNGFGYIGKIDNLCETCNGFGVLDPDPAIVKACEEYRKDCAEYKKRRGSD